MRMWSKILRWRVALALVGLVLLVVAGFAWAYLNAPLPHLIEQQPLSPTLFAPP